MSHDYYNHFIEGSKELLCVMSIQAGNTTWHCNLERHTNITPKGNSDHGRKTWNLSRNSFPHHSLPNTESIKRTILFWSLNKALVLSGVSILRYFHINQVIKNSSFLVYFIKNSHFEAYFRKKNLDLTSLVWLKIPKTISTSNNHLF